MESVNFDRAAGFYDATRALPAESMDGLIAMLADELGSRQPCLEIGVGTGRIALPLHDRGIALAGADISGAMLRRLVANAGGTDPFPLVRADATSLPLAADSFGSVLAVHVLHLIPGWRVAVDEALRVLRPGGALVASFPGGGSRGAAGSGGTGGPGGSGGGPGGSGGGLGGSGGEGRGAGRPPWAEAVRESLRSHALARVRPGVAVPEEVARYLGARATARQLPPVTVRRTQTLRHTLDSLEGQLFSWSWPYTAEQVRAAGADVRAWADRENVPLDAEFEVVDDLTWWAFDPR